MTKNLTCSVSPQDGQRVSGQKKNIENVTRLIAAKKMKPAGMKEIEAAKADGRWEVAYDSPSNMEVPKDFLKELAKNPKAKEFFKTLNKTNLFFNRLAAADSKKTGDKRKANESNY